MKLTQKGGIESLETKTNPLRKFQTHHLKSQRLKTPKYGTFYRQA